MNPPHTPPKSSARLLWAGLLLVIAGVLLAHFVQTAGGVRIQDVRFTGTNGTPMSAHLYVPPNATAKTPAPGVLAVHGYFNSREAQSGFAIEFARRGYVVLALDQTGHGYSAPPAFANAFGGIDGLKYLRSLDIVDKDNIGLEGHSMGGWAVVNAAAAMPDAYKALVLEGSSTGKPFAPEGTPEFPRNLAVVFSRYDEFPGIMWNVPTAAEVSNSKKLQSVFATDAPVEPGRVYGSLEAGTARVLYTPAITHPMDHISPTAIGHAVDWFQRTLKGGSPKPAGDQVWYWKEAGTLLALIGLAVFVLGTIDVLLRVPAFSSLRSPASAPAAGPATRGARWWTALLFGAVVPALSFLPLCRLGGVLLPASPWLPQLFSNEIAFWALGNALIVLVAARLTRAPGASLGPLVTQPLRALSFAATVFVLAYALVATVQFVFNLDVRIWFIALKPMSRWQAGAFPVYLVAFAVYFVITLRVLHAIITPAVAGAAGQYLAAFAALGGGFVAFLCLQYGLMLSTHRMLEFHMFDALRTIISINFVPLLAFVAAVSTFAWRRTGNYLPGALVSAAFVAWYVVVGQATQAP
ncbi:alpha/beta hydrolase family protein [Ideonella sp.]|uniref:alpha/beta hydrolase family protein n=1 Tax=Ideonella sp. TaxID=1929293 RepID=UPI002B4A3A57|nr:alpha/beta fold hydrolase [Ideonella sp.]HJV69645.1 alpha/beta fold hydrolase [Ideonella sp.]